ncbi:MAG: D-alanyl-lipoteichoic acid biosynthesis protein DltD [Chthoniobacteraceae bacterium]
MTATPPRHHLQAFGIAAGFGAICAIAVVFMCARAEGDFIHGIADELSEIKLQGVALQKTAFTQPDLLVLYGSSELASDPRIPNKAVDFFERFPTGFRVFTIGKAGTTALATMQRVAAIGRYLKGRKAAFSISPSYFLREKVNAEYYLGNFSALAAAELAFSRHVSPALKRDAARRMLEYPETLEGHWILDFALRRLAGDTKLDHLLHAAIWPLGRLANAVGRAQDHVETGLQIAAHAEQEQAKPAVFAGINWKEIIRKTSVKVKAVKPPVPPRVARRPKGSMDASFLKTVKEADEWDDFELLLRALKEMDARPLLLSMPLHGNFLESTGVSAAARQAYGNRLKTLVARYGMPLVYFQQYENDPTFFADNADHPSDRGWVLFDKVLDDFYHDRLKAQ